MTTERLITPAGAFASRAHETAFRAERLPRILRHTRAVLCASLAIDLLLLVDDLSLIEARSGMRAMLVTHLGLVAATLGGLVALRSVKDFAQLQRWLLPWQAAASLGLGAFYVARPEIPVLAALLVPTAFMLVVPLSFIGTAVTGSVSALVLLSGFLAVRSSGEVSLALAIELVLGHLTVLLYIARSNRLRRLEWAAADVERRASLELAESRELFETMFRAVPVPIVVSRAANGQIVSTNDAGVQFFGLAPGDTLANYANRDFLAGADRRRMQAVLDRRQAIRDWEASIVVLTGERRDVLLSIECVQIDGIACHVSSLVDITSRKAAEAQIRSAAHHDVLTGLPNRALFQATLETALARAEAQAAAVGLILLDLDAFKEINDTLGHDSGDALLKEVALRLCGVIEPDDLVARLGGDEFVVICTGRDAAGRPRIHDLAERILDVLHPPMPISGRIVAPRASLGLALYPDHAGNSADLFTNADLALYAAKASGRNRATLFVPALRANIEERVAMTREMRAALDGGGGLEPHYQPKINLLSGAVIGFEALARWHHPVRGLLAPGAFSAVFDDPEIGVAVGDVLRRRIIADLLHWISLGLDPGRVFLNLSTAQFAQGDLAGTFLDDVDSAGLARSRIGVEVTETVLLGSHGDRVSDVLAELHGSGIRVALDDFGTGYASLTHLKQFPVDEIKIDRSFIRDLERDANDAAIVTAVLQLGRSLALDVTAEGVETAEQAAFLRDGGCTNVQGYLYGKPMPASRVPWFLRNRPDLLGDAEAEPTLRIA
ncbi:hypothetical protein ASG51_04605 [Methylobacterium sp. Leaf465]|uniref:putative bifunctional diguanylate cyclase/phosphodiesterase n=1 Tax=Methylobacterium sp. Leaf465 TaxID=1736385 RepID=UPI0006FF0AEF|nr:EAL domain-containing protein [Methylobacterium sp. Leaf465]KQT79911.1 hypothetical protein ASG51_04605 [Methylobacterium sp. Leaf465]